MYHISACRRDAIRQSQNELLYQGIKFSAVASIGAAVTVFLTFRAITEIWMVSSWLVFVTVVYLARYCDYLYFRKAQNTKQNPTMWSRRLYFGAMMSSVAWASSMWLVFPSGFPAYQVLLVLALGGICGGALASLAYDSQLSLHFQLVLFLSVELKLLLIGDLFAFEVAVFSLFIFVFLISCGKNVGLNYHELLNLKQITQDTNITLIKTTEEMAQMGYWQWDQKSEYVELSDNLANLLGLAEKRVLVRQCAERLHTDDRRRWLASFSHLEQTSDETVLEFRLLHHVTNQYRHMRQVIKHISSSESSDYLLGTVQDISDIKSAEARIYTMAYHDSLTGLANRAHFHEHLTGHIRKLKNSDRQFAIAYIDLDNFKGVNDTYGHECGDAYLSVFAKHLNQIVGRSDLVARLGGDEFCILIHDFASKDAIELVVTRCLHFTQKPIQIGNHRIHPKMSIGVSVYPDDGLMPDEIVKSADLAMYYVKQNGKDSVAFYHTDMALDTAERVRLEADLRQALANEQFELWYQPQLDLHTGMVSGVEALIRWQHPEKGMIPPDLFISTAERVGLIKEIGEWVVHSACEQLRTWNLQGYRLQMAVNISGDHFADEQFVDFIGNALSEHHIYSGDFEVEITESLSRDPTVHTRICNELRSTGVRIAIDDFGTGYSSLSVLRDLEVDTLKIDKSFIDGIPDNSTSILMVKTIVELSHGLGYEIVAEGVELDEQMMYLKSIHCHHMQGYLFSKPLEAEHIPAFLSNQISFHSKVA